MRILGGSAFYHDSAAALIEDGNIVAATQEDSSKRALINEMNFGCMVPINANSRYFIAHRL